MTNNEPPFASIHRGWVIAIGLVVFSLGLALFTAGAHHRLVFMEKLGEVILVVMSLHFLYEQFVRRVDRYAAHEQMSALLQPQQEVLERLDQRVGDLGGKIADLESRFSTSFNVIPYTDGNYFEKHWEIIVDKFDQLALIGDCPHEIWFRTIDKVHRSSGGKKHLTIYTSVDYSNKSVLQEIVKNHLRQRGRVQIRHVERTDLSFIALGWNARNRQRRCC